MAAPISAHQTNGERGLWPAVSGAPGRTRTCNLLFRRQLLCPLSYRGGPGAGYRKGWARTGWCGPLCVRCQVGRLRTNRPRDCQEVVSWTVAVPVGTPPVKATEDRVPVV